MTTEEQKAVDEMKSMVKERTRTTIMDGRVVTIATGFREVKGLFKTEYEATGPFEISVSRNAIIVHRAELRTQEADILFIFAMGLANERWAELL